LIVWFPNIFIFYIILLNFYYLNVYEP
jgi:hypothetical protein